jgi:hypothetical protein
VEDLLAEMKILKRSWPSLSDAQRVLVIGNDDALLGRKARASSRSGGLVRLAARRTLDPLLSVANLPADPV